MKISVNSALSSLVGVFLLSSVSIDYQTVHAATLPAPATNANKIELTPITESRIAADGRSRVTFSGRILDASGQPIEDDAIVTLTTSAGKFIGVDVDPDLVGFQVRAINGAFTAELQSDLKPQKVEIRAGIDTPIVLKSNSGSSTTSNPSATPAATQTSTIVEVYSQIEFTPNLRPGLVAGSVKLRFGAAGMDH